MISVSAALSELAKAIGDREGLAALTGLFKELDLDGNGTLDVTEFTVALRRFGLPEDDIDDVGAQKLFDAIDTTNDGIIDFDEFSKIAKIELEMKDLNEALGDAAGQTYDVNHEAAKTAEALKAGVRINRTQSTAYDLKMQGDIQMLSEEMMAAREDLKDNPTVLNFVQKWWDAMLIKERDRMSKASYIVMSIALHKHFVPDVTDEDAMQSANDDWAMDCPVGASSMRFEHFYKSVFELCDMWVDSTDANDYIFMLRKFEAHHKTAEQEEIARRAAASSNELELAEQAASEVTREAIKQAIKTAKSASAAAKMAAMSAAKIVKTALQKFKEASRRALLHAAEESAKKLAAEMAASAASIAKQARVAADEYEEVAQRAADEAAMLFAAQAASGAAANSAREAAESIARVMHEVEDAVAEAVVKLAERRRALEQAAAAALGAAQEAEAMLEELGPIVAAAACGVAAAVAFVAVLGALAAAGKAEEDSEAVAAAAAAKRAAALAVEVAKEAYRLANVMAREAQWAAEEAADEAAEKAREETEAKEAAGAAAKAAAAAMDAAACVLDKCERAEQLLARERGKKQKQVERVGITITVNTAQKEQANKLKDMEEMKKNKKCAQMLTGLEAIWKRHKVDNQRWNTGRQCPTCALKKFMKRWNLAQDAAAWPAHMQWLDQCVCDPDRWLLDNGRTRNEWYEGWAGVSFVDFYAMIFSGSAFVFKRGQRGGTTLMPCLKTTKRESTIHLVPRMPCLKTTNSETTIHLSPARLDALGVTQPCAASAAAGDGEGEGGEGWQQDITGSTYSLPTVKHCGSQAVLLPELYQFSGQAQRLQTHSQRSTVNGFRLIRNGQRSTVADSFACPAKAFETRFALATDGGLIGPGKRYSNERNKTKRSR
jgi:Ca2+-binding EF-hand superfamily protein